MLLRSDNGSAACTVNTCGSGADERPYLAAERKLMLFLAEMVRAIPFS
jgi:hypothetical protein